MELAQEQASSTNNSADWQSKLSEFQQPSIPKAVWQLTNTLVPYVGLWVLMAFMLRKGLPFWTILPLALLAGGLLIRVFIFFHDCTHDCFFSSRRANRIVGYITGILTLTAFDDWRHKHALHHAGSGNLDRRGAGEVWTMTVDEFNASPFWTRVGYRLYRHPFILLVFAPPYLFFVLNRFPAAVTGERGKRSTRITNLSIAAMAVTLAVVMGWKTYLQIQLPVMTVAAVCGVWLFYVQHQYEKPYWVHQREWDPVRAALEGSSYYKLPKLLQWFSGNIGLHHIHHLKARIPNYNLQACYDSIPALQVEEPLTILKSFTCLTLNLWDEKSQQLVRFRHRHRSRCESISQ